MRYQISLCYLLLAGLLGGCGQHEKQTETTEYKLMTVSLSDRILTSTYTARLTGQQVVEIRPQVSGLITRICIGEGETVHRGQLLFVIDQVPYQAAWNEAKANVKSAQANLATARLNLESTTALREQNVVLDYALTAARNEFAAAEAQLAQAEAQEINARNNLSYTEVKSPVDGVAGMINYRVGALVSSSISEPLVTVSDDNPMYAYFSLTENQVIDLMEQYGSLEEFMQQAPDVELCMSNGQTYGEKGRIRAVSGLVTSGTGAVTLRADFPNDKRLLRSGGSGSVLLPATRTEALVIPQGATYELQNKIFVYKIVEGKTHAVPVTVFRLNNGTEYVVESGLQAGDVILAEGAGLVREGTVVDPQKGKE
ncbi:MAG: efflux RND transporter periplasmic adaptor subunit [Parabacteroides sp.]